MTTFSQEARCSGFQTEYLETGNNGNEGRKTRQDRHQDHGTAAAILAFAFVDTDHGEERLTTAVINAIIVCVDPDCSVGGHGKTLDLLDHLSVGLRKVAAFDKILEECLLQNGSVFPRIITEVDGVDFLECRVGTSL